MQEQTAATLRSFITGLANSNLGAPPARANPVSAVADFDFSRQPAHSNVTPSLSVDPVASSVSVDPVAAALAANTAIANAYAADPNQPLAHQLQRMNKPQRWSPFASDFATDAALSAPPTTASSALPGDTLRKRRRPVAMPGMMDEPVTTTTATTVTKGSVRTAPAGFGDTNVNVARGRGARFDSGMVDDDGDLGLGEAGRSEKKRERERKRREMMNVKFEQLAAMTSRTSNLDREADMQVQGPKVVKETILADAVDHITSLNRIIAEFKESNANLKAEVADLRSEKQELRTDNASLRSDRENLREENNRLREDMANLVTVLRRNPPPGLLGPTSGSASRGGRSSAESLGATTNGDPESNPVVQDLGSEQTTRLRLGIPPDVAVEFDGKLDDVGPTHPECA